MKVRFFVLLAIFVFSLNLFSQGNSAGGKNFSAQGASRRTALRYLKLAKSSALSADWENAPPLRNPEMNTMIASRICGI